MSVAGVIVVAAGVWLIGLAGAMLVVPTVTKRFLMSFASSARWHYTEQLLRLVAGVAFIVYAPGTQLPRAFAVFGWIIVVTGTALLVLPWRWHRRFAERVVPLAIRHLKLHALGSFVLGVVILWAALT